MFDHDDEPDEAIIRSERNDGDTLPYYTVDQGLNNYSYVSEGFITFDPDGTWSSLLVNPKRVDGENDIDFIDRQGTFSCGDKSVLLVNDLNQDAGILTKEGRNTFELTSGLAVYMCFAE